MTPKEKVMEIACHNCCCSFEDKSKANCRHYNNVWQMHEWTKQQMIDSACEYLYKNTRFTKLDIKDFKKAMEEQP